VEYEAALKASGVNYVAYVPKNESHHNTTPRYDAEAAKLAWQRTIEHFSKTLKS
jgi:carboxymethylenebutenolidase